MGPIISRRALGTAMVRCGLDRLGAFLHDFPRASVTILTYHRVLPARDLADYPFDAGVVSTTPETFERQMRLLREEFEVITVSDLALHLSGRRAISRSAVMVTFDDGYRDNYLHAFPVLRNLGVPATVFLATDYIGSRRVFWFDRASLVAMRGRPGRLRFEDGIEIDVPDDTAGRRAAAHKILAWLKRLPQDTVDATLARFEEELGVDPSMQDLSEVGLMTWDDVREMAAAGIEFGSHSVSHAILAHLPHERLVLELVQSRARIEAEIGSCCVSIAYPVGRRFAFSEAVQREAALAGYEVAMSYVPGGNRVGRLDHFALRRQSVELDVDLDYFRAMTRMPFWFH